MSPSPCPSTRCLVHPPGGALLRVTAASPWRKRPFRYGQFPVTTTFLPNGKVDTRLLDIPRGIKPSPAASSFPHFTIPSRPSLLTRFRNTRFRVLFEIANNNEWLRNKNRGDDD